MLQNLRYYFAFPSIFRHLFSTFFSVFVFISCSENHSAAYLQTAEDLLWKNPDSCLIFLDSLEQKPLSEHDANVCALMHEHANFKINYGLEDDSALFVLKDYFESIGDYRYAGEANYIIGRNLVVHQNSPLGTFYLKVAEENLLKLKDVPSRLLGMIYYGLGNCAETDRLFEIANEYYGRALPLFIASNDSLYICSTYRNFAKSSAEDSNSFVSLMDSALRYIPSYASMLYTLEIDTYKKNYLFRLDPFQTIRNYHLLCDSMQELSYATELCDYYLSEHDLEQAYHYLTLSALDTANSYWSLEHYLFNKAAYLSEIGLKDSAIAVLQDLHLRQTEEIESSAFTRSYMVEQRYDAERERSEKEKAHADKRMALLSLLLVIISALLIISVLLFLWWRDVINRRHKKEQMKHIAEQMQLKQEYLQEKLQYVTEQLKFKQEQLQKKLKQRLDLTNQITHLKAKGNTFTKATYTQLLSSIAFTQPEQWEELISDFDNAYAGVLSDLTARYNLTNIERISIALIVLGCSSEDIALLLRITPQSASNRKQLLRQRFQIEDRLEDWLQSQIQNSISGLLR